MKTDNLINSAVITVTVIMIIALSIATLSSVFAKQSGMNSPMIEQVAVNLKKELDIYQKNNVYGFSGNEDLYNKLKENKQNIKVYNCAEIVSDVCLSLEKEKGTLKDEYNDYSLTELNKIKIFYDNKVENDKLFLDIKEQAVSYLANKTLNENFHNKAYQIVYSL